MRAALDLAAKALGRTSPNPAVGAVIVKDGEIIAGGYHAYAGADHAEVAALRTLGFRAEGCTLYSTLEPCNHQGRTGPCTEAILRSGIVRVVVGAVDPNPIVRGRGLKRLRAAGIEVEQGALEAECRRLNEAFNHAIVHRRPFVVLKAAISLDGRTATVGGDSQWITSPEAREEGRRLRDRHDAILVGIRTVLADDPELTTRLPGGRDPVRVVLDSHLRIPLDARLVTTANKVRTIVATTARAPAARVRRLGKAGVEVLPVKHDRAGRVDLEALLASLYACDVNSVLVEGGATVHGAFVDRRLVNKLLFFVAPLVIGGVGATPAIGGKGAKTLADALVLELDGVRSIGRDLLVTAYAARPRA